MLDAALGRAELLVALELFAPLVDARVVGHDQMSAVADEEIFLHGDAQRAQAVDLLDERDGVDDDAVADHADLVRAQDAGGDQMQDVLLAAEHDGVAGVVAALAAHDEVRMAGEHVDDLAFSFVAPLRAYKNGVRHTKKKRGKKGLRQRKAAGKIILNGRNASQNCRRRVGEWLNAAGLRTVSAWRSVLS